MYNVSSFSSAPLSTSLVSLFIYLSLHFSPFLRFYFTFYFLRQLSKRTFDCLFSFLKLFYLLAKGNKK